MYHQRRNGRHGQDHCRIVSDRIRPTVVFHWCGERALCEQLMVGVGVQAKQPRRTARPDLENALVEKELPLNRPAITLLHPPATTEVIALAVDSLIDAA